MDEAGACAIFISILVLLVLFGFLLERRHAIKELSGRIKSAGHTAIAASPKAAAGRVERHECPTLQPESYKSLQEGLHAISQVFGLSGITVSTLDGLLVASSASDADEEAAVYSQMYLKGEKPTEQGVHLLPIQQGDEKLLCILKDGGHLDGRSVEDVRDNIIKILKYWL